MTDPKLREARIKEAKRRADEMWGVLDGDTFVNHVATHLFDLIEQDWRPEPEVDAVTLAAREWMKANSCYPESNISAGRCDNTHYVGAFRAGHAHALADHPDAKRMDWLERLVARAMEGGE